MRLSPQLGFSVAIVMIRACRSFGRSPVGQRWSTFVQNHAHAIVACDFFTSVTATFQVLYVFIAMEIGTRRILHTNVTDHPTAEWTRQQFRAFHDGESASLFGTRPGHGLLVRG
jgi:putative transposase